MYSVFVWAEQDSIWTSRYSLFHSHCLHFKPFKKRKREFSSDDWRCTHSCLMPPFRLEVLQGRHLVRASSWNLQSAVKPINLSGSSPSWTAPGSWIPVLHRRPSNKTLHVVMHVYMNLSLSYTASFLHFDGTILNLFWKTPQGRTTGCIPELQNTALCSINDLSHLGGFLWKFQHTLFK